MSDTEAQVRGQRAAAGRSWSATVEEMLGPVYHFVRARVPAQAVDDLVQEVFTAASRGIGSFEGHCPIWNWLSAIARNKIAEYYRRGGSRRFVDEALDSLGEKRESLLANLAGESPLPDEICEREEFRVLARVALSSVSPEHRECLMGRYYEDCSLAELARRLGISTAAANARLHRARQELRRAFLRLLARQADEESTG